MDPDELTEMLAKRALLRKIQRFVAKHGLEEVLQENVLKVMNINLEKAEHHELQAVDHMIRTATLFHSPAPRCVMKLAA